ncbi:MAG: HAD family phosphatase [Burkholderiales bacterium]|nr:HAD family phosphatase [Burkholderiales bacterium]
MKPADALLFDLGGVVMGLDWDRAFRRWSEACGDTPEALRARYAFDEPYERHERGEIGELDYYAALRRSLGIDIGDEDFRAGWGAIFTEPVHETVALLERLKERVPLYAFSNTNEAHHAVWSKQFEDALANFRRVFVSSKIGLRKPDAASFELIAREIGVAPSRILFFDDTLANVEGARRAGLQAVHVRGPDDVRNAVRPWL